MNDITTEHIKSLEQGIQAKIENFEELTGLEVTSIFRSFDKDRIVVTLVRATTVIAPQVDVAPHSSDEPDF